MRELTTQGLQAGDLIYTFAGIQAPTAMAAIGPLVQRSEGVRYQPTLDS